MASMFNSAPFSAGLLGGMQLLLDLAIKSVIVMLAAWAVATLLSRASAAARHWVWSAAIISLLALPALSRVLPNWQLGLLPSLTQGTPIVEVKKAASAEVPDALTGLPIAATATESAGQIAASPITSTPRPIRFEFDANDAPPVRSPNRNWPVTMPSFARSFNWGAAALVFWLIGALLVVVRLLSGTFRIWRLANLASQVTEGTWLALAHKMATQLRLRSKVELRKSEQVRLPMTWGALRSVVMLPADADEWPQECRGIVLLHELAHVKRRDCLTQNLAQLACALYWFNPLVWLAAKQLHVERELACDDQVLEVGTKASEYASHLVEIAKSFSSTQELSPAVGMACSQLESRVRSILDPGVRRRGLNRLSACLIAAGATCLILSLAVAQPWSKTSASPRASAVVEKQVSESGGELRALEPASETEMQAASVLAGEEKAAKSELQEAEKNREQEEAQALAAPDERDDAQDGGQSKARSSELTADQLIEMRAAGVTPEFIEAMRKQGFDNLTVRELTQLSVHGINADYIKQARGWGGDKLTVKDIVNLKVSGVTPEYISAMKQAGYDGLTARQLAELSIHGVTPEFVSTMRRLGYDNLTANQLAALKIHGVDEAFVKEMQNWTGGKPTVNELTQIKIHGVTPEFARQMKALGYDNLSINKLAELKIHGVDEAFIREMQNWTGAKPTVNELLQIKIHGVTPEFANRMKAMGYDNLPINKLTEMRIHGVDEQFVKEMRDLGFDKLTVDQLIKMRIHGVTPDYVKKMRAAGLKNVSVNQMIEMRATGIDAILLKEKR